MKYKMDILKLVIIIVISSQIACDFQQPKVLWERSIISNERFYEPVELTLQNFVYVKILGISGVSITYTAKSGKEVVVNCFSRDWDRNICPIIDLRNSEPLKVSIKITSETFAMMRFGFVPQFVRSYIQIIDSLAVHTAVNEKAFKFMLDVIQIIPVKVLFRTLEQKYIGNKSSKIQFNSMLDVRRAQVSDEKLLVKIKKGNVIPNLETQTSVRTVNFSKGLIATIIDSDEDFCLQTTCEFSALLITNNIHEVSFDARVFENYTPFPIQ